MSPTGNFTYKNLSGKYDICYSQIRKIINNESHKDDTYNVPIEIIAKNNFKNKSHKSINIGEVNGLSKITNYQREEIVFLIDSYDGVIGTVNSKNGAYPKIMQKYEISKQTAHNIYNNRVHWLSIAQQQREEERRQEKG